MPNSICKCLNLSKVSTQGLKPQGEFEFIIPEFPRRIHRNPCILDEFPLPHHPHPLGTGLGFFFFFKSLTLMGDIVCLPLPPEWLLAFSLAVYVENHKNIWWPKKERGNALVV